MVKTVDRKLHFGTAGIPKISKGRGVVAGLESVAKLGLEAMELEFVRGVYMSPETAKEVKRTARALNIYLTAHAPYWLNLNSLEPRIVRASMHRIVHAALIADAAGARSLAFHPAYYCGLSPREVYGTVKGRLQQLVEKLSSMGLTITLSPELTGRASQFGTLEEILRLCSEIPSLKPCIDFAHVHARTGHWNTYREFDEIFRLTRGYLGRTALNRMHMHVAGIDYGSKGETRHLSLKSSDFDFKALLKSLKRNRVGGVVICESPNPEKDALLLKRTYIRLT
jgi:deoxyribonuclease-4